VDDILYGTDREAKLETLVSAINEGIRALAGLAAGTELERGFEFRWGYHSGYRSHLSVPEAVRACLFWDSPRLFRGCGDTQGAKW